jgi:hypothetical protein
VRRFIAAASTDILFDARGPKCLVIISIHIKESQDMRIPPSKAIKSVCKRVLFAKRFIQMTLTTKSVTTVAGIHRNRSLISAFSRLSQAFIRDILKNSLKILNYKALTQKV